MRQFLRDFQTSFFLQLLVLQYYFNALFFKAYQTWEDGFWFVYIIKLQLWVLLTKYIKMPSWHTPGRLIFLLSKVMSKVGKNIFATFQQKGCLHLLHGSNTLTQCLNITKLCLLWIFVAIFSVCLFKKFKYFNFSAKHETFYSNFQTQRIR